MHRFASSCKHLMYFLQKNSSKHLLPLHPGRFITQGFRQMCKKTTRNLPLALICIWPSCSAWHQKSSSSITQAFDQQDCHNKGSWRLLAIVLSGKPSQWPSSRANALRHNHAFFRFAAQACILPATSMLALQGSRYGVNPYPFSLPPSKEILRVCANDSS